MSRQGSPVPPAQWSSSFAGPVQTGSAITKLAFRTHDKLKGGLADRMLKRDFDHDRLEEGVRVEREHVTSKDLQEEIASDHLAEDPDYYKKLKRMESGSGEKTADLSALLDSPMISEYVKTLPHAVHNIQGFMQGAADAYPIFMAKAKPAIAGAIGAAIPHFAANAIGYMATRPAGRTAYNVIAHPRQTFEYLRNRLSGKAIAGNAIAAGNAPAIPGVPGFSSAAPPKANVHEGPQHALVHGLESRLFQAAMNAGLKDHSVNQYAKNIATFGFGPEYSAQIGLGEALGGQVRKSLGREGANKGNPRGIMKSIRKSLADPRFEELVHTPILGPVASGLNDLITEGVPAGPTLTSTKDKVMSGLGRVARTLSFFPNQLNWRSPKFIRSNKAPPDTLGNVASLAQLGLLAGRSPHLLLGEHFGINVLRNAIANSAKGQQFLKDSFMGALLPKGYFGGGAKDYSPDTVNKIKRVLGDVGSTLILSPAVVDPRNLGESIRHIAKDDPSAVLRMPIARQLIGRNLGRSMAQGKGTPLTAQSLQGQVQAQAQQRLDPAIVSLAATVPGEVEGALRRRPVDLSQSLARRGVHMTPEAINELAGHVTSTLPQVVSTAQKDPAAALKMLSPPIQAALSKGGPTAIRQFFNTVAGQDVVSQNTARTLYNTVQQNVGTTPASALRGLAGLKARAPEIYSALMQNPDQLSKLVREAMGGG
jgi:hypothetical protein